MADENPTVPGELAEIRHRVEGLEKAHQELTDTVNRRFAAGSETMAQIKQDVAANTEVTNGVGEKVDKMVELMQAWQALKGFSAVTGYLFDWGKKALVLGGIAVLGSAAWQKVQAHFPWLK